LPSEIKRSVAGLFRRKTYLCAIFSAILSAVAWRRRKPPATAYDLSERKARFQSGKPPEKPTISNRAKLQRQLKWQQSTAERAESAEASSHTPFSLFSWFKTIFFLSVLGALVRAPFSQIQLLSPGFA
jgi:hypothetical protein